MSDARSPKIGWLGVVVNLLGCLAIVAGTYKGIQWIRDSQPEAQQENFKRKSSALVETITAYHRTWSPSLIILGTVRPAQEIVLSPRVRGQVLNVSSSFVPGGMVQQDELLLQIDPADFDNAVSIRKSELEQVEASWKIEQGRQSLAQQELQLLGDSIDDVNRALVLREPQAASLRSQLNAAKAAVQRAELDLERTRLLAPFAAQVLRRNVNVGSQVQSGDDLGQLVGVKEYWVMAAVPVRHLRWIQFAENGQEGSLVSLHDPESWGADVHREGRVSRMIGSLDQQTRLARVLVTVTDPLGLTSEVPPLILDTIIEVRIEGIPIPDVVRLKRNLVHDGDTVWVMENDQLKIKQTTIAFRDSEYAYVSHGLEDGDEVVTTTLATVADGVQLRKVESSLTTSDDDDLSPLPTSADQPSSAVTSAVETSAGDGEEMSADAAAPSSNNDPPSTDAPPTPKDSADDVDVASDLLPAERPHTPPESPSESTSDTPSQTPSAGAKQPNDSAAPDDDDSAAGSANTGTEPTAETSNSPAAEDDQSLQPSEESS